MNNLKKLESDIYNMGGYDLHVFVTNVESCEPARSFVFFYSEKLDTPKNAEIDRIKEEIKAGKQVLRNLRKNRK